MINQVSNIDTSWLPKDVNDEARICLTCPLKGCKKPLQCERYKEEYKKITGKRKNNTVKRNKKGKRQ